MKTMLAGAAIALLVPSSLSCNENGIDVAVPQDIPEILRAYHHLPWTLSYAQHADSVVQLSSYGDFELILDDTVITGREACNH